MKKMMYTRAKRNLELLRNDDKIECRHGVDATELNLELFGNERFDRVIWNFPYPPGKRQANVKEAGRRLLERFFSSVMKVLDDDGQVILSLLSKQREAWQVESLAAGAGLALVEEAPFRQGIYEGYQPMREVADEGFPCEQ